MNINIKNLNNVHLDPFIYINERVDIHDSNVSSELDKFYQELLNIEEALFFKKEKLKKGVEEEKKGSVTEIINPLLIKFNKIKLEPLKNIEKILVLTKEIEELKNCHKILSILSEIDKRNYDTLENLYNSDDPEDWMFFSELIVVCEQRNKQTEITEQIIKYSKRMEDKLNMEFKKAYMEENNIAMRDAYAPMNKLNRTRAVLKNFINNLSIMREEFIMEKSHITTIDLEFYEQEENSFHAMIKTIKKFYQKEIIEYENVFDNFTEVLKKINSKIYDEKILKALETFLDDEDPVVFLLNLKDCFKQIESLNSHIVSLYPQVNNESCYDIFEHYIPLAVKKESEAFDKIFSILVYNKKSDNEYLILGKNIASKLDSVKKFKILLSAFNFTITRGKIFNYEDEDINILTQRFSKRTIEYLREVTQDKPHFETLDIYFTVFVITKKYFSNSKIFSFFEYFTEEFSKKIEEISEMLITESKRKIKHIIRNQSLAEYNNTTHTITIKKLVDNLQTLTINSEKYIKDKNSKILLSVVSEYAIDYLNNFYLTLSFSEDKAKVLLNDLGYLAKFFKKYELFEFYEKTNEVKYKFNILVLDKDNLEGYIKTLELPYNEVKKTLKCRNDYANVKDVLKNI
ncbi:Exocyst complex component Sec10 [Spraguea lophii 42_110]|uniref:Exocyst complex component Sec10 n=1 Tax=Spraguea lophii (strain 42_110) TaxID=1358809 RepID=S7XHF8_SPRLO|nr:Exocyst complex component Sec10 [Spraguea lophii 42_110]